MCIVLYFDAWLYWYLWSEVFLKRCIALKPGLRPPFGRFECPACKNVGGSFKVVSLLPRMPACKKIDIAALAKGSHYWF